MRYVLLKYLLINDLVTSLQTEREMVQICEGTKTKDAMLTENIDRYKEMYIKTKRDFNRIVTVRLTRIVFAASQT